MTARTQRGFTQIAGPSPSATLNQTLDANGNRLSLSASIGGTADFVDNYTYDDLERLTSVTQGSQTGGDAVAPKRVNFSYDEDSQWSTISQYADLAGTEQVATATYNYDYDGNLTGLSYAQANSTGLPSYTWTYNAAGLVTQMTSPDGTVSDTYDADNQLTQALQQQSAIGREPHLRLQRQSHRQRRFHRRRQPGHFRRNLQLHVRQRGKQDLAHADLGQLRHGLQDPLHV